MSNKNLTEKEACTATGLSRVTFYRLRDEGKIGFYKIGNRIFYAPHHIQEFLARNERPAKTDKRSKLAA